MAGGIQGHASQPAIYTVISTSALLAILAVALRLYTRFRIVKKPDCDDLLSALALLFTIVFTICVTLQTYNGLGRRLHTLSPDEQTASLLCLFIAILAYQVSLGLAKLSIVRMLRILTLIHSSANIAGQVAQCLRVFGSVHSFRVTCYVFVAVLTIYTLYTTLITIFLCQPTSFFWDPNSHPSGRCLPTLPIWFLNSALGIATDIAVAILPIPMVKSMHLSRRRKNMLIVVFSLGGAVCIVSIIQFYSLYAVSTSTDWTYDDAQTAIYSSIEVSFSIIFGCLPSYNAFLGKHFSRFYYGAAPQEGVPTMPELNEISSGTITSSEGSGQTGDSAKELSRLEIRETESSFGTGGDVSSPEHRRSKLV